MSPRVSDAVAAETRSGIIEAAVRQASMEGLESVTIGRLAGQLNMSKAGVIGPFGTKEEMQLAALEEAILMFTADVWTPVEKIEPGMPRLEAVCESWLDHLMGDTFPGGCFLTQSATEFDGRPGPVRDRVANYSSLWEKVLARDARIAVNKGDLPVGTDPSQVAFEIGSIAQGVNQAKQLRRRTDARKRGRLAIRRILSPDRHHSP
ncbi:MAG: helix-turn-helix domain-containing protein [Solirubrobacterales bacterium]